MVTTTRAGDVLADRYRLVDLLSESGNGRFWRAHDRVLERHVAMHVLDAEDPRAPLLLEAARRAATVVDSRFLRVLDLELSEKFCFVVNEWGSGTSLDIMLATHGALEPREAAWLVAEVADSVAKAHAKAVPHGRLVPENILVDTAGAIRIIGFCVDAALHGLPPGDVRTDVRDLAALLYAGLTATWGGDSSSLVPPARRDHGRVLRPRQVRAGVPRALDDLCEEVLSPRGSRVRDVRDVASARGMHAHLSAFVGDAAGLGVRLARRNPDKPLIVNLPFVPDIMARPDHVEPDAPDTDDDLPRHRAEATPVVIDTALGEDLEPAPPGDQPTEAGLPIFDDETGDVSWLEKRRDPPPPPPPLADPPERPLFADAEPRRTPPTQARPVGGPHRGPSGDDYWPGPGSATQPRATSDPIGDSSDRLSAVEDTTETAIPGSRWLRAAGVVAIVLLLVVAVAIAINLGRGRTMLGSVPDEDGSTSPSSQVDPGNALQAVTGVTATDFDPEGNPPRENPELAPLAVDGDPATGWETSGYFQQLGPDGLKQGVGLVLDLGDTYVVRALQVRLVGDGTAYSVFLTDEAPRTVDGLTAADLDELTDDRVGVSGTDTGRFLVLWLTALPELQDGRFRGEVQDVVVEAEVPGDQ